MADKSNIITNRILTDSNKIKGNVKTPIKSGKWSLLKGFLAFFGVDPDKAKSSSDSKSGGAIDYGVMPPPRDGGGPRGGGNIRDVYHVNPVDIDNIRIYMQGQDGRGDPPEPGGHGDR